ncbi:2-oxoglutarate dehydrogenase, E2 component, dihydrolipoamide succinyltransferase [Tessaracoccus sp. ZS01]|uniref:2-oxoglutarate dehydrogenase, E2 component, dihydrolipoamide succinyltransferase n=1 Tax=Tessaracoccus sp. ZS01 TaxID=1906324 RepID=UPI00096C7A75|nr:2-oxoglutarate dehydrogenase, E2 component, dihydrolipoamide succinyltransferase [Tessaracoccus sp. ZS01]MCG6566102.1 2-oxoglutarate dehydrogenase, E2 component, dihydrolipoamide succinyltransferase [Tessaracoccus sp. ZS01]OMG58605.1 dihydrolipoamide acyltransferase [Tessaracoccus sp. ZS01]
MSTEVTLPALGESVTEGTISRWLKAVGDTVEADEPLLEVSTDKVDTEIPSPVAGTLLEIRFEEDDVAEVGAVLAVIGDAGESPAASDEAPAAEAAPEPQPEPEPEPQAAEEEPVEAAVPAEDQQSPAASAAPAAAGPTSGTEVTLPALGESVTEGTISRWLKAVGDAVEADEALLEVSTDKVDTEIPSPVAGTLLEIRFQEDETANVGDVLAIVGDASAQAAAPAPEAAPAPQAQPEPEPEPEPEPRAQPAPQAKPAKEEPKQEHSAAVEAAVARRAAEASGDGTYVTPLVRKLAKEHGVELNSVKGTGVGGRIRKQDVLDAAQAAKAAPAPAAEAPKAAAAPAAKAAPASTEQVRGTTEKLSRLRKVIAARMVESLQTSAQLTATVEVDLTAISHLRNQVKADFKRREGASLSYLPFITMAAVEALKQFPIVNATIDVEAGTMTYADGEHVGIAVDTDRGLLVPVIKEAGNLNLTGLAKKIGDLAARTRNGQVGPDELSGGSFTITNYGSAGTLFDTPIVNQPQVAILGTGALVKRPVVVEDRFGAESIAIRHMMYLSLSYDHRLIDGAVAARFLSAVKERLEDGDFGGEFGI